MTKKILVIDDEPAFCQLVRDVLCDCTVLEAHSWTEARKILNLAVPDLVVLDLVFPDFSGRELLELMQIDHRLKSVPVVIVTGQKMAFDEDLVERDGAVAYFTKPLPVEKFRSVVEAHA